MNMSHSYYYSRTVPREGVTTEWILIKITHNKQITTGSKLEKKETLIPDKYQEFLRCK